MINIKRWFGNGQPEQPKKSDATTLTALTAVDQLLEMMGQYYDPDKMLQELGKSRTELKKLLNDDEISAALETRLAAVLSTGWHLESADTSDGVTDFVKGQLLLRLDDIITAAWHAVPFGYSVMELVYKKTDNRYEIVKVSRPPFEWFRPQQDGRLLYYPSFGDISGVGIPVDNQFKFFETIRRPAVDNTFGEALLTQLWWPWFFRINGWDFWAKFLERHGSPLLIGKTMSDTQGMADALNEAVQSAVLAINHDDNVEAIGASNNGESFDRFHAAIDKRIQKVILGQTLTSDVGSSGSYAAAKVHNDVRQDRRIADCSLVSKTVNRVITSLVALNYPGMIAPKFVMEDNKGIGKDRAERDKILVDAGMVRFNKDYIVNNYDLEHDDFDVPSEQNSTGQPFSMSFKLAAQPDEFTPQQQALEALADDSLNAVRQPVSTIAIRAAISKAKDPEDLANRLASLLKTSDTSEFNRVLERALFAADVIGYVASDEQQP